MSNVKAVPFSSINRLEKGFCEEWLPRVESITRETSFIKGPWLDKLENRLKTAVSVQHAKTCANGTDALQLALRALNLKPGARVLIPDLTFWATFEAVYNVGAVPYIMDVDFADLHPSAEMVAEAIHKFQPDAMILVHLYGWAARDTLKIRRLCADEKVALIEDSAQAWGTLIDGKSVFAGAEISTTSFFPGKVLGAAGDGGAVFTDDAELAERVHLFANHGRKAKYEHHVAGYNSRLDTLQAAFLDLSLNYVEKRIESRLRAIEFYKKLRLPGLEIRHAASSIRENGYLSVALVDPNRRESIIARLDEAKIGTGIVYPIPVRRQPGAKGLFCDCISYGNSDRISASVLSLPCFAGIEDHELERVREVLETIFK